MVSPIAERTMKYLPKHQIISLQNKIIPNPINYAWRMACSLNCSALHTRYTHRNESSLDVFITSDVTLHTACKYSESNYKLGGRGRR